MIIGNRALHNHELRPANQTSVDRHVRDPRLNCAGVELVFQGDIDALKNTVDRQQEIE